MKKFITMTNTENTVDEIMNFIYQKIKDFEMDEYEDTLIEITDRIDERLDALNQKSISLNPEEEIE